LEKQARAKIRRGLEQLAHTHEKQMLTFFHNMEDHSSQFQVASTTAAHTHEKQMLTFFHNMEDHSSQFQVASTAAAHTHE
jgi:hypothetical protein